MEGMILASFSPMVVLTTAEPRRLSVVIQSLIKVCMRCTDV